MSTARQRFADRFAHPRLATLFVAGVVVLVVGAAAWLLAPTGSVLQVTGFRMTVVGYLLALAGGAGYLSFAAFEFRDRNAR